MRPFLGCVLAVVLGLAVPAHAQQVRLGLGADYVTEGRGELNVNLAVGAHLARHIEVGGRFGALFTASPDAFGVPLDLFVRAHVAEGRVYLEGLVGPWIYFEDNNQLRIHAAFGFGLRAGNVSFGLEVGYLSPRAIAGVRIAFALF